MELKSSDTAIRISRLYDLTVSHKKMPFNKKEEYKNYIYQVLDRQHAKNSYRKQVNNTRILSFSENNNLAFLEYALRLLQLVVYKKW